MYIAPKKTWYLERVIWLIAGVFSLAGALLGYFVHEYWLLLNVLVGVNLVIFALTGFCTMANILVKCGLKSKLK